MAETTKEYEMLLNIIKTRMSVRKFRPDPIPDDYVQKILEVSRWAMSGANSQPWEFIVVKDPDIKRQLRDAYSEYNTDYIFWMEQQREYKLRHPSYQVKGDPRESLEFNKKKTNWHLAPAVIVVLGDGRRQWGTVMGAHTFGRGQSHLTDGLANASFLIHLAVAALGLTSEWVSIHVQEPFKRILGVPDLLMLYLIIPIGYPDVGPRAGTRRPLHDIVHHDRYDMSKYMTNEDIIRYLYGLREATVGTHAASRGVKVEKDS
ncbi:MAG: nitroreductase family protein [Deltaproteobacteria bacterium]|nr:nitroreductase family protein [Deltaproteobacteria bacterium]